MVQRGTVGDRMARPGTSQVGGEGRRAQARENPDDIAALTARLVARAAVPRLVTWVTAGRQATTP